MRTHLLLASLLPPLAVALTGRWGQALLNVPLTMLGWLPGAVHAVAVVYNEYVPATAGGLCPPSCADNA